MTKTCNQCGRQYETASANEKSCSLECAEAHFAQLRAEGKVQPPPKAGVR